MSDARSNTPIFRFIRPKKVKTDSITLRPFFILFLAFVFLFNSLGGGLFLGELWAAKISAGLPSVGPDRIGGPTPLKELNAGTFTLPQELGYVQESAQVPNSVRTVLHIQDAHCNYAAQKSISEILNYLTKEYGAYAVNCEGGAKDYDLSPFTIIPEKDVREKTSDFFVKEGIVNAAEFFAVNNPEKVKLWGVEDPDLYIKNLKVYRDSLAHKEEVDRFLKSLSYVLDNLKRQIYSSDALEFDNYYTRFKDNKISFKEYMAYLITISKRQMVNIKSFPNIYILSQVLEQEEKINFRRANSEKDEVVDKLKKILSRNELEELITKVAQMKTEHISQSDFYAYLVKKSKSIKLDLDEYPELQKYVIYISLYGAVDRTKITQELDSLEDRISETLYENDTQRELSILSKNLILTKNIFNISLTRDDYKYYEEHKDTFAAANYINFINAKAPLYKIKATLDDNITRLDVYRESMENFYECSLERDRAFVKNIKFTDHDRPTSIIITGGFHTENLRELFKKEKVSYISIMPKFKNEPGYESPYLKRLAGQRTALENVIDTAIPAVLNLQVVNVLNPELVSRVEGATYVKRICVIAEVVADMARMYKKVAVTIKDLGMPAEKRQEDKVILFTEGGGGTITHAGTWNASSAEANEAIAQSNRQIELIVPSLEFKEILPQAQPSTKNPSAVKGSPPLGMVISEQPKSFAENVPVQVETVSKLDVPLEAREMYASAQGIVPQVAKAMRRGSPTYLISPVASIEDIAPTTSNNRRAEQILGKEDHQIHAKSYLAQGEWPDALKELLRKTLPDFEKDLSNPTTRMAIRFMPDKEGKILKDIKDMIKNHFQAIDSEKYNDTVIEQIFEKQIHFIPISMQDVKHLNASIDLFTDIGMMEIDRYIKGDYPGEELPPELRDRFLALLKISISNFDDLIKLVKTEQDIRGILDAIFKINILLKIKPVDWSSVDQWRKAQDAVLKSL